MNDILKIIWNFLTSRNLAIALLSLVTVMLAVGAVLPNPALLGEKGSLEMKWDHPIAYWLGERYNSQKMATGYMFGFIGVFLILSTALCSIDRLVTRFRVRGKRRFAPPESTALSETRTAVKDMDGETVRRRAGEWLRRKRWKPVDLTDENTVCLAGVRGEAGFWGSVFFHAVLITALFGMAAYYLGGYRGTLVFTEGQAYPFREEMFTTISKKPIWGLRLPNAEIGLLKHESTYSPEDRFYPLEHVSTFRVTKLDTGESWQKEVKINDPLVVDGEELLLMTGGYSPRFVLFDGAGRKVFDNFVALTISEGGTDFFSVPELNIVVKAKLFPDFVMNGDEPDTKSRELVNPVVKINITSAGRPFYDGYVPSGGEIRAGGYRVAVPEVREWVQMELAGEPGIGFFFVVSFFGIAGIILRMWDSDERLYVMFRKEGEGTWLEVIPYSRHFPGLAREKARELLAHLSPD